MKKNKEFIVAGIKNLLKRNYRPSKKICRKPKGET